MYCMFNQRYRRDRVNLHYEGLTKCFDGYVIFKRKQSIEPLKQKGFKVVSNDQIPEYIHVNLLGATPKPKILEVIEEKKKKKEKKQVEPFYNKPQPEKKEHLSIDDYYDNGAKDFEYSKNKINYNIVEQMPEYSKTITYNCCDKNKDYSDILRMATLLSFRDRYQMIVISNGVGDDLYDATKGYVRDWLCFMDKQNKYDVYLEAKKLAKTNNIIYIIL